MVKGPGPSDGDSDRWDAWEPSEAAHRLAGVKTPWYVAAGWAIDLFLGGKRREHEDLEIAIPAAGLAEFVGALAGFEIYAVKVPGKGTFTPVDEAGDGLAETHQTWVRDPESEYWRLDLFREPGDGSTWICRRDERIRLRYDEVIARTDDGVPYGRPEVILLYKAKHAREKDEADFEAALPHLDAQARERLAEWLELVHPGHRWLPRLHGC
jgi:aminoglycoside-2''-adenylyltransferase